MVRSNTDEHSLSFVESIEFESQSSALLVPHRFGEHLRNASCVRKPAPNIHESKAEALITVMIGEILVCATLKRWHYTDLPQESEHVLLSPFLH